MPPAWVGWRRGRPARPSLRGRVRRPPDRDRADRYGFPRRLATVDLFVGVVTNICRLLRAVAISWNRPQSVNTGVVLPDCSFDIRHKSTALPYPCHYQLIPSPRGRDIEQRFLAL